MLYLLNNKILIEAPDTIDVQDAWKAYFNAWKQSGQTFKERATSLHITPEPGYFANMTYILLECFIKESGFIRKDYKQLFID